MIVRYPIIEGRFFMPKPISFWGTCSARVTSEVTKTRDLVVADGHVHIHGVVVGDVLTQRNDKGAELHSVVTRRDDVIEMQHFYKLADALEAAKPVREAFFNTMLPPIDRVLMKSAYDLVLNHKLADARDPKDITRDAQAILRDLVKALADQRIVIMDASEDLYALEEEAIRAVGSE